MVNEIEKFKEHFKGYEDCYTIIGRTAYYILMSEVEQNFRATKDIDLIILFEDRYKEFAKVFWNYIKQGKYSCGWEKGVSTNFYCFVKPKAGYPV